MENTLENALEFIQTRDIVWNVKQLIGVLHLPPLPGSPGWEKAGLEEIVARARADADTLVEAGFDAIIVENFGDAPFFKSEVPRVTLTVMASLIAALQLDNNVHLGVNVLRNDALGALAVAAATDASFIRVNVHVGAMLTDQGLIEGRAAETLRRRTEWAPNVKILADVAVKHAQPLGEFDLVQTARDTLERGLADGLIVTGKGTGQGASLDDVRRIKSEIPEASVLVGSGVDHTSVKRVLSVADGVIVGTALKVDGCVRNAVDINRAKAFVQAARS